VKTFASWLSHFLHCDRPQVDAVKPRSIRKTPEERRIQRLHDIANIFESAFGGAQ